MQRRKTVPFLQTAGRVDVSNLKLDYDSWSALARTSWQDTNVPNIDHEFDSVILTGMGGSGITGDLICDIGNEQRSPMHFSTVKDYHLPGWVSKNSIIVGISCSGNTEETLSVLSESSKRGLSGFTFGSGGLLESYSKAKWNFQFTKTKMLKVPRSSLPGLFYPVLKFFKQNSILKIDERNVEESLNVMDRVREAAQLSRSSLNTALAIAKKVTTGIGAPLVYSSARTRAVGLRFRQSLNENAKIHSFNSEIPELCHNEVVCWDSNASARKKMKKRESPKDFLAVSLRLEEDDPPEVRARFDVIRSIIIRAGGRNENAPYSGSSYLARIISMLYTLDFASYFAAVLRGKDPIKTPSIDFLKNNIALKLNYISRL